MYNYLGESTLDLDIKDTVNQLSKRVSAINEKMYEFEQTKVNFSCLNKLKWSAFTSIQYRRIFFLMFDF